MPYPKEMEMMVSSKKEASKAKALEVDELAPIESIEPDEFSWLQDDITDLETDELTDFDDKTEVSLPEKNPKESEEAPWQTLHPYSLLINLLPHMWQTIQNTWPILLFIVMGKDRPEQSIDGAIILVFLMMSILKTVIHFLTLRFRMHKGKLMIKMGLIFRQARTLDPARIQNIEITQNPLHKWFNLVELRMETAGDASTKGLLSAITNTQANSLKAQLQQSIQPAYLEDINNAPIITHHWMEVLLFGLSKRTIGTVVVLSAIISEGMSILDPNQAQEVAANMSFELFIGLLCISFAGSWLWSALQATLSYFRLEALISHQNIRIISGLLTKRQTEIPQQKVQIIEIFEPWLRRQMGFASMYIETAALGLADGQLRQSEGIIPMIPTEHVPTSIGWVAPRLANDIWKHGLKKAHPYALYRLGLRNFLQSSLIAMASIWLLDPYGWVGLIAIPISFVVSYLDYIKQGWIITAQGVLSRYGYLTRRTRILDRQKIQNVSIHQDPFMIFTNIAQVNIWVAGSKVRLPLVDVQTAHAILQDLSLGFKPFSAHLQQVALSTQQEVDGSDAGEDTRDISN